MKMDGLGTGPDGDKAKTKQELKETDPKKKSLPFSFQFFFVLAASD